MIFNKSIIAGQKGKEAKQVTCCSSFVVSVSQCNLPDFELTTSQEKRLVRPGTAFGNPKNSDKLKTPKKTGLVDRVAIHR